MTMLPHLEDANDYMIGETQQIIASPDVSSWAQTENAGFYPALRVASAEGVNAEISVTLREE